MIIAICSIITIYTTYTKKREFDTTHMFRPVYMPPFVTFRPHTGKGELFVNDGILCNSIVSLKHRCNMDCVPLFYRYYSRFCSSEINGHIPDNYLYLHNTRLSRRPHPFVVDRPPIPYGLNSFFSRTIRAWNSLCPEVVIFTFKE